ncbi:MAG: DUF928 domain-containing protein [Xenococcaceae cyanobacterium MO_188.B19]|nr:DUF928 domain-containing protein [Xenococcaceae cyanobacterium MO_188.B19]
MVFRNTILSAKFFTLCSIFLAFLILPVSANGELPNYNPKPSEEKVDQRRTTASGSRSICESPFAKNSLNFLIPETEIAHYTVSSTPDLYIYAKTPSEVPLSFSIVIPDINADNPKFEKTLLIEKEGFYKIKLPLSFKLKDGTIYVWQIAIPCLNDFTQTDQVLRGAILKVPVAQALTKQLSLAENSLDKARIYAENGIWYDALSSAAESKQHLKSEEYIKKLLKDINLNIETDNYKILEL